MCVFLDDSNIEKILEAEIKSNDKNILQQNILKYLNYRNIYYIATILYVYKGQTSRGSHAGNKTAARSARFIRSITPPEFSYFIIIFGNKYRTLTIIQKTS